MADLPTREELVQFEKDKLVAYATRSAMRAYAFWGGDEKHTKAVQHAIKVAAETASGQSVPDDSIVMPDSNPLPSSVLAAYAAARAIARVVKAIRAAYAAQTVAENATDAAARAAVRAARSDFEKLKTLPDGPLNCGPRGALGPVWPEWKPERWDESKLDFVYESGGLEPEGEIS